MGVAAEQDLDVFESKAQFLYRILNGRSVPLIDGVDKDVPLRRGDEKRRKSLCADIVDVSNDLMRRELFVLLFGRTDVACEEFLDRPHTRSLLSRQKRRTNEQTYKEFSH